MKQSLMTSEVSHSLLTPLKQVEALAKYAEESDVVEQNGEDVSTIQDADRRTGVAIKLGISGRVDNGHTLFTPQVMIESDGTILDVHRKLQLTNAEQIVRLRSKYVDQTCLDWIEENLRKQDLVKAGGG